MNVEGSSRVRVKVLVALLPGVHLRELQRLLSISFNSTRYHVESLYRAGQIEYVREKGYLRLYPPKTSEKDKKLYSILRNKTNRELLAALTKGSNHSNKQIAETTGLAKSTVSERLKSLIEQGVIKTTISQKFGVGYELEDAKTLARLLSQSDETVLEDAVDRFIELWDI